MVKHVDSGGQVHLVTNIRKPRKWRRYEYLLSSGILHIDTGVGLASNIKIEMSFTVTNTSSIGMLIGAYYDYVSAPRCLAYTQNNKFSIEGFSSNITSGTTCTANQMYNLTLTASAASMNTDVPLWLFARSNDNGNIIRHPGLKIYSTKIYSNDTLVRDFVPAQYNGQYGMWDLVENKFYRNAGTGAFTVGPEMKNYDEIYEVRKTSSLLPAGVELYDYIQSSGGAYLITNYAPNLNMKVKTKIMAGATTNEIAISGYSWTASSAFLMLYQNTVRWHMNSGNGLTSTVDARNNAVLEIEASSNRLVVNNVVTTGTAISTYNESNYYLFYTPTTYGVAKPYFDGKMYYFQIYDNGTLVRNFLPCTYLGEPGMWDTVENKFYRNQGTGLFTLGNKITLKEYEYLQGDGNAYIDTGWVATNGMKVLMLCMWRSNSNELIIIGSHNTPTNGGSTNGYNRNHFYNNSGTFYLNINDSIRTVGSCQLNTIYNIEYSTAKNLGTYAIINNSVKNVSTSNMTLSPINNVVVLLNLWANTASDARIYYIKLFNYLDNLIRDFIPVSYNGTPGLWDKVEWKFYGNAGSGSFTLGPEKKSGSIYLHSHLTNLFDGFIAGGLMTLSNGVLTSTGVNSDTYFFTKTTQAVNTTSYYLVGVYVEGYDSATTWTFCCPQNDSNATLRITRDGWNWGCVKFGNAGSLLIWDDANRAFSGPIPKITISDCRIYKIT